MIGAIILQVILIPLNAVFTCSETAIVSLNDNQLEEMAKKDLSIEVYELSGYQLEDENNFENKELVSPQQTNFTTMGSSFSYEFPKKSVTIFRIK